MTRRAGFLGCAVGVLLLAGCSATAGDSPAPSAITAGPDGADSAAARPVIAPGTTVATGDLTTSNGVSGSVAIRLNDDNLFELIVSDLSVTSSTGVQFTLTADALAPDASCLDSDWRLGLGQAASDADTTTPLVFPIGGTDGIGQGDPSFIREIAVSPVPDGRAPDKNCPIPLLSHANLAWTLPDMRPGLTVSDAGTAPGAEGVTAVEGGEPVSYTVAQGDQLATIAARFGLALDDLFYLNPRRSPNPEDSQTFTGEKLNLSRDRR